MNITRSSLAIVCLGLSVLLILSGLLAGYYYEKFHTTVGSESENGFIHVNICIDYQKYNGTVVWYNNTRLPAGSSLYKATIAVAVVNVTNYGGDLGYFVNAIDGVWNNANGDTYWMWYDWSVTQHAWIYGSLGVSTQIMQNGETIRWRYETPTVYG